VNPDVADLIVQDGLDLNLFVAVLVAAVLLVL
jgi:hypothetical protein